MNFKKVLHRQSSAHSSAAAALISMLSLSGLPFWRKPTCMMEAHLFRLMVADDYREAHPFELAATAGTMLSKDGIRWSTGQNIWDGKHLAVSLIRHQDRGMNQYVLLLSKDDNMVTYWDPLTAEIITAADEDISWICENNSFDRWTFIAQIPKPDDVKNLHIYSRNTIVGGTHTLIWNGKLFQKAMRILPTDEVLFIGVPEESEVLMRQALNGELPADFCWCDPQDASAVASLMARQDWSQRRKSNQKISKMPGVI